MNFLKFREQNSILPFTLGFCNTSPELEPEPDLFRIKVKLKKKKKTKTYIYNL